MLKKLWNKIKNLFTPKKEIDEHIEFYTKVPEPEIPVHTSEHCKDHTRFRKSCPMCMELANG